MTVCLNVCQRRLDNTDQAYSRSIDILMFKQALKKTIMKKYLLLIAVSAAITACSEGKSNPNRPGF
jgi:hypothetical protein